MSNKKTQTDKFLDEGTTLLVDPTRYPIIRKGTTFVLEESDIEHPVGVSMTIPDHTMDMRTIYDRYVTGRPIDASIGNAVYHTDDNGEPIDMPNIKALDLVEIGNLLEATRENRALLEHQYDEEVRIINELEAEKARKEKAEDDERLFKEYEKRRKANEL